MPAGRGHCLILEYACDPKTGSQDKELTRTWICSRTTRLSLEDLMKTEDTAESSDRASRSCKPGEQQLDSRPKEPHAASRALWMEGHLKLADEDTRRKPRFSRG